MDFNENQEPQRPQMQGSKRFGQEQENHTKDYSSVEKYVKLPQLRQIKPEQNFFPPPEPELVNSTKISEDLKETMISLRERLRTEFKVFEDPKHFTFTFPESKFPAVQPGKRNEISYEQKNIVEEEDTFREKLSVDQLQQIAQNGEFKVKSNFEYITLPYVWKINDTLFRGRRNVELAWFKGIAKAHSYWTCAKRLYSVQIPKQVLKMSELPSKLFSLFLGKRSIRKTPLVDYNREVAKDFWNEVIDKHYTKSPQWGSFLFQYLDTQFKAQDHMTYPQPEDQNKQQQNEYKEKLKQQQKFRQGYNLRVKQKNEKKQKITKISDQFESKWSKSKKKVLEEVSKEYQEETQKKKNQKINQKEGNQQERLLNDEEQKEEEQKTLLERLNNKKFSYYTEYLQKKLPQIKVPEEVIRSLVCLLTIMQLITQKQRNLSHRLRKEKSKIQKEVREKHKILSNDWQWYSQQVSRRYLPIENKIHEEYYNKFVDLQLNKKLNMRQKEVYLLWLEYRVKFDVYVEAKKRQYPERQEPTRTFYTTYELLPPYKIIKQKQNDYDWYDMVRKGNMQITTDKNFWKLNLYLMRVKSWTINCVVFLIYSCWKGPLGLRCLWSVEQFVYDQTINYQTGEIIDKKRLPFLGVFKKVLEGIKKSRQNFEALPDRGLFGKNISRYVNYAQCYIFRLLIVGVVITLILHPLVIVIQSVLMFVLILTVWLWMPVVLLVTYLFNIIFFQFQISYIGYGFFIKAAPLLSVLLSFVWSLAKILGIIVFMIVIAPLIGFFISLWTALCRVFRTVSDTIMLFLIRKLGRTPSRNTAIATKIAGPGMSKQFYMSINEQDVYILVQSQLEKLFMQKLNKIWKDKINQPLQTFNQVMKLLLKPYFGVNYYNQYNENLVIKNVYKLQNLYQKAFSEYMNRYPSRPYRIRFTQQQIDSYFDNTVKIVQNFVKKHNIESWVFDHFQCLFNDYEELTRKIWITIFNCGEEIFQPLEKIDQRFKLQDMFKDQNGPRSYGGASMKKNIHKVMEALQGEVQLRPTRANITPFKHSLLNKELPSTGVSEVFNHIENNSANNVKFSTFQTKFIFYPHLSIKQVIKKDNHEYELKVEAYQKEK